MTNHFVKLHTSGGFPVCLSINRIVAFGVRCVDHPNDTQIKSWVQIEDRSTAPEPGDTNTYSVREDVDTINSLIRAAQEGVRVTGS